MVSADLVVEDELSETIVRRLLSESNQEYHIRVVYARGGYGQIKKNINRYNVAAQRTPFIIMTDLDTYACPPELVAKWFTGPISQNLLFRIAVREPEAWVMGDQSFAKLLGVSAATLPISPESIPDPKLHLLAMASKSRFRNIREGIVRVDFGKQTQGPDYNGILSRYVSEVWDPVRAEVKCPSLLRMRQRIDSFRPR